MQLFPYQFLRLLAKLSLFYARQRTLLPQISQYPRTFVLHSFGGHILYCNYHQNLCYFDNPKIYSPLPNIRFARFSQDSIYYLSIAQSDNESSYRQSKLLQLHSNLPPNQNPHLQLSSHIPHFHSVLYNTKSHILHKCISKRLVAELHKLKSCSVI